MLDVKYSNFFKGWKLNKSILQVSKLKFSQFTWTNNNNFKFYKNEKIT